MNISILYIIVKPLIIIFMKIKCKCIYINKDKIPKKSGVILAGNHTSGYDGFILGSSTRRIVHFLIKDELVKGPKGILFKMTGIIPVNRRIHDRTVIPTAVKYLKKGAVIGIFPEGTINHSNDMILPFKKGAIIMALESKAPIVPFAITGKYNHKTGATIHFGKAYHPHTDDIEKEIKILENKVIELMKR